MSNAEFIREIGIVRATKHYLISVEGLPSAHVHDIIMNEEGGRALVTTLSHDAVEAMILDPFSAHPGQQFELHERANHFSIGPHLLGRMINALGDPIDGKGGFPPKNAPFEIEREAGDLARRSPITKQLVTGFSMVDTVLPIGRGQRQLLMGQVRSGTDAFCREVIRNQNDTDTICIYVTIGKPAFFVRRLAEQLLAGPSATYTTILASFSSDPAPLITLAPSVALYIAEYWSEQGKDVVLVLDDLYTHAKYLREIALLEGRLPGRDSYPGDIFYQQAHLIERAGSFAGKGSITLLPILQTDLESYTDLIMTNVMGTTDGHLSFSATQYAQGVFPPILEEESVTRVGKHTQSALQKQLSTAIMALLAEAKEHERYTQFGAQVSDTSTRTIFMAQAVRTLLDQEESERMDPESQAVVLALPFTSFSSDKDPAFFLRNRGVLREVARGPECSGLRDLVQTEKQFERFLHQVEEHSHVFAAVCRAF